MEQDASPPSDIELLRERVLRLARRLDEDAAKRRSSIEAALPQHRASALNLAQYLDEQTYLLVAYTNREVCVQNQHQT